MATTKRRRIELIFFEQERIVTSVTTHCPICRVDSQVVTPQEAVNLAHVDLEQIYQWLEQGRAHSVRTLSGDERICKNSLCL